MCVLGSIDVPSEEVVRSRRHCNTVMGSFILFRGRWKGREMGGEIHLVLVCKCRSMSTPPPVDAACTRVDASLA